ncbi:MAG TPA: flagellar hook capping FlgD N-terminal domain-containing protein [Geminicoccaceae bacterium]
MQIEATAPAGGSAGSGTARDPRISLAENFDGFLKLLTTQLTNQDPLEPLDANVFIAQLVQFTGVEHIKTNGMLEELLALTRIDQLARGADFIGASVTADAGAVRVGSTATAAASYRLAEPAASVDLKLRNEAGAVIRQGAGGTSAGTHSVSWNGLDTRGQRVSDGLYRVEIEAFGGVGRPLVAETTITGTVDAVELAGDGRMKLSIDGMLVPSDAVTALSRPPPAA